MTMLKRKRRWKSSQEKSWNSRTLVRLLPLKSRLPAEVFLINHHRILPRNLETLNGLIWLKERPKKPPSDSQMLRLLRRLALLLLNPRENLEEWFLRSLCCLVRRRSNTTIRCPLLVRRDVVFVSVVRGIRLTWVAGRGGRGGRGKKRGKRF